eukprot:scaffold34615_cov180-Amphora_coffeaeformis.AAC.3
MRSTVLLPVIVLLEVCRGSALIKGFVAFSRPFSSSTPSTSVSHGGNNNIFGAPRRRTIQMPSTKPSSTFLQEASISIDERLPKKQAPTVLLRLNAATKWGVTVACTSRIWFQTADYQGPFVVVGAIASVYIADILKQIINHDRPAGAPFTDPGMPSSHSLVTFFLAASWTATSLADVVMVQPTMASWGTLLGTGLAWIGAAIVALLRVVCGYHSWDQIAVGALLGIFMGWLWAALGRAVYQLAPAITFRASWASYLLASAFFIAKNMRHWVHKEKHL